MVTFKLLTHFYYFTFCKGISMHWLNLDVECMGLLKNPVTERSDTILNITK